MHMVLKTCRSVCERVKGVHKGVAHVEGVHEGIVNVEGVSENIVRVEGAREGAVLVECLYICKGDFQVKGTRKGATLDGPNPSNGRDGHVLTALDGCSPSHPPSI